MRIVIRESFLTPLEAAQFLQAAKTLTTWDALASGTWKSRIAHADQLADNDLRDKLVRVRTRIRADIAATYGLVRPLYADTLQIVRWPEGYEQAPHADAQNPDGTPHEFSWRSYASLIYLNNDFEGGRIYFPTLNVAPTIKPGMLVYFPGTLDYLHGVSRVTRGERFTVASFWTFDPSKRDRLPL